MNNIHTSFEDQAKAYKLRQPVNVKGVEVYDLGDWGTAQAIDPQQLTTKEKLIGKNTKITLYTALVMSILLYIAERATN